MLNQSTKILIIDDEPVILTTLEYLLKEAGFCVKVAADGNEGLEVYEAFQPDLVVTDVVMPGLDGSAVVEALRKKDSRLPIIMMSGVVRPGRDDIVISEGAFCHLSKPVDIETLLVLIRAMLIPVPDAGPCPD